MELRNFGLSNLKVTVLGFGCGKIGDESHSDKFVEKFLNEVLDSGITHLDIAN